MVLKHGPDSYSTARQDDHQEGWSAIELYKDTNTSRVLVARMVYWDAEGQFSLEMRVPELPLRVAEALIEEAKRAIMVA